MARLREELNKADPFDLPEQEAYLALVRTAAELEGPFHALFKTSGLSPAAYNILRILRGHHGREGFPHGVRSTEIGRQMVVRVPDVTRLVDRLEGSGLVSRFRCTRDRRVVYVDVTPRGLDLLAALDEPLRETHRAVLGHLTRAELSSLIELLDRARGRGVNRDG